MILLATLILAAIRYAYGSAPPASSSSEGQQIGKILSVRKVFDEIDDLFSAKDKDVKIVLKGKTLTLRTPKGWEFKARLVEQKQC